MVNPRALKMKYSSIVLRPISVELMQFGFTKTESRYSCGGLWLPILTAVSYRLMIMLKGIKDIHSTILKLITCVDLETRTRYFILFYFSPKVSTGYT